MTEAGRPGDAAWVAGNQQHLLAWLARFRAALSRYIAQVEGAADPSAELADPETLASACAAAAASLLAEPAVDRLAAAFSLSPFERDVLLLCAGVELDAAFATCCTAAQGDAGRASPTFGLALAALAGAHWSALGPGAPLRYWRLIEVEAGGSLTGSALRIDERVLHYLVGVTHLDERLMPLLEPLVAAAALVPSHREIAERAAQAWAQQVDRPLLPVVQLSGEDAEAKRDIAAAACVRASGWRAYRLGERLMPATAGDPCSVQPVVGAGGQARGRRAGHRRRRGGLATHTVSSCVTGSTDRLARSWS